MLMEGKKNEKFQPKQEVGLEKEKFQRVAFWAVFWYNKRIKGTIAFYW